MSESPPQYLEEGFVPTVTEVESANGYREYKTLDPRSETDLVPTKEGGLVRKARVLNEDQVQALSALEK